VTRIPGASPKCTCNTKAGIVAAIVVASIFSCCVLVSLFVCVRRRRAVASRRKMWAVGAADHTVAASLTSPFADSYRPELPVGQPKHIAYNVQ